MCFYENKTDYIMGNTNVKMINLWYHRRTKALNSIRMINLKQYIIPKTRLARLKLPLVHHASKYSIDLPLIPYGPFESANVAKGPFSYAKHVCYRNVHYVPSFEILSPFILDGSIRPNEWFRSLGKFNIAYLSRLCTSSEPTQHKHILTITTWSTSIRRNMLQNGRRKGMERGCWRIKLVSTYDLQAYGPTPFSPQGFPRFSSIAEQGDYTRLIYYYLLTYPTLING
jgi:hypothetical protein